MANRVLIISPSQHDIHMLRQALADAYDGPFDVDVASTLADGVARIQQGGIDAILVDLTLPDGGGLTCFDRVYEAGRHTPILTMCDLCDEEQAKEAVQRGAQGWLSKGYFDHYLTPQSLRNIIERMKVEQRLYVVQARAEITLNSIGDAVISVDMHGRVDYLNVTAELVTGWPREEAEGRPIEEVLHIVDGVTGRQIVNPIEYVLQNEHPLGLTGEVILVGRYGRRLPIEDSVAPIHDWNGQLAGAVIVFRDISDTVELTSKIRHQAQHDFLDQLAQPGPPERPHQPGHCRGQAQRHQSGAVVP